MPVAYQVNKKIIISGQYVEFYDYEKGYIKGMPRLRSYHQRKTFKKNKQSSIRDDNVRRTRQNVRRLINCNEDLTKFLTLTFRDEILDLEIANKHLDIFVKRMKRKFKDFKYLAIPEFQKKGRVHYHILTNIPFIHVNKITDEIWGKGYCYLRKVYGDNYGAYVCKYLTKEIFDSRLFRKRKFLYSRNLLRPVVVDYFEDIKDFMKIFKKLAHKVLFKFEVLTEFLGVVKYKQVRLTEENLKVVLLE